MYDFYGYVSECRGIEIKKDENFTIDIDKVIETCNNENVKLLIFSNPCNPTSVGLTREAVRKSSGASPRSSCLTKPIWTSGTNLCSANLKTTIIYSS